MKKLISMVLAMGLVVSMFAGCGGSESDSTAESSQEATTAAQADNSAQEASETSEASGPVKLVVWGGVPGESGPQDLVEAWNAENPNINVEYVRFVNDDTGNTKLDTGILSGEQIDIFFTYSVDLMKKRVESGMIQDLSAFDVDSFIKAEVAGEGEGIVTIDDTYFALPTAKEPVGIMLNKEMMDAKGVTIPDNWSYDDFAEIAVELTDNGVYGTHAYYAGLPINFAQYVLGGDAYYNEDGTASNFDAPEFEVNARVKELMDGGYAMPYEELVSRKLNSYSQSAFLGEEIAMMPFSAWMLRYVKDLENYPHDFVTTFAPFPTTEAGVANDYQAQLNNFICMNSQSEYKEEAWAFMDYWVTEGSKYMYKAGKIPVWKNADAEEVTAGILGEDAEKLFDVESYKKVMLNPDLRYIVDTHTTAYAQLIQIYKEENEMYFLGATDKETYLNNLKTRADQVIVSEQ